MKNDKKKVNSLGTFGQKEDGTLVLGGPFCFVENVVNLIPNEDINAFGKKLNFLGFP
jgi:hypothetical protein